MADNVQAIKECIASNQAVVGSKVPALSVVDDDLMSTTLSASLMMNAEFSQPWSTIGFDQWIGAGKWWLYRAQLELHTIKGPGQSVAAAAYADLIKAGWILADVIPGHPQYPFISASKSSEIQSLSTEVKNEFSRITALAMVVPALGELSSQHLRLWESISIKAPILRPYKVSQDLNAWRADGGEHVLFRRFAFREMDLVTSSPCILLFLVHENAKAARLIAQDQYDEVVRAISFPDLSFPKNVNRGEDGKSVMVGQEKFVLDHVQEAQVLCNMIEATTFYLLGRQADHASLEDLKAYMLLTAVKNREGQAAAQIRQEIFKIDNTVENEKKGSLARLAVSMTSQWMKGQLLQFKKSVTRYSRSWICNISLLNWAVMCNYTTLVEILLSEDPVLDGPFGRCPLLVSAEYGNEPVVRWSLNRTSDGPMITESLVAAIKGGRASVIALLVGADANLNSVHYNVTHPALRSALSAHIIHAILAMAYATRSGSESCLRKAADRGHEGAIVLLFYADDKERKHRRVYETHSTQDSRHFEQLVAILARDSNTFPAFDLTLMAVERRRTEVLVKVDRSPRMVDVKIYLDSYHAYIEDVPEGLSGYHKKGIKVEMSGEFSITVVHQEESLIFSAGLDHKDILGRCSVHFEVNGRNQEIVLVNDYSIDRSVVLLID